MLFTAIVSLAACKQTPVEKAQSLIKDNIKVFLEEKSSYEPGPFGKLDSSFLNATETPAFADNNNSLQRLEKKMEECNATLKAFLENKATRAQADSANAMLVIIKDSTKVYMARNNDLMRTVTPEFLGYQMPHTYKIKDGAGNEQTKQSVFYLDSALTKVIAQKEVGK